MQEPKKKIVNGSLSFELKCFKYATGPIKTPKASTNNSDPIDHKRPNFLGLTANTGNKNTQMVKQAAAPNIKLMKSNKRSVLDNENHEGS